MAKKYQFSVWKSSSPLSLSFGCFLMSLEDTFQTLKENTWKFCHWFHVRGANIAHSLSLCKPPMSYALSRAVFQIISFIAYTLLWALISVSLWLYYGMTYSFPVVAYWSLLPELGMISGFLIELFEPGLISDSGLPMAMNLVSRSWSKPQDNVSHCPRKNQKAKDLCRGVSFIS